MRLLERRLRTVKIAPRVAKEDGSEAFSNVKTAVRARIVPAAGGVESRAMGLCDAAKMCLLMPAGCGIQTGDGVCIDADEPEWRCVSVQEWANHATVQLERIAGR